MTACVDNVLDQFGRIDLLINNAGHGQEGTLEELTMDELRQQMEVNFFGAAEMTKRVLPVMRSATTGRIVSVSSIAGAIGQPFNDAYCASKFALEGLMQSLSMTLPEFGITVSVVEPGPVATPFLDNAKPVENSRIAGDPYGRLRTAYLATTSAGFAYAQTAESCAEVVVEASLTSEWKFRWQTSKMATSLVGFSLSDLDGSVVNEKVSAWLQ
jgi:NAD(P)-dependent dehydrogenase (short-subunit alcohol dehydrogenase family)